VVERFDKETCCVLLQFSFAGLTAQTVGGGWKKENLQATNNAKGGVLKVALCLLYEGKVGDQDNFQNRT